MIAKSRIQPINLTTTTVKSIISHLIIIKYPRIPKRWNQNQGPRQVTEFCPLILKTLQTQATIGLFSRVDIHKCADTEYFTVAQSLVHSLYRV